MHDISELELLGVPGVFVASDQFVDAVTAQATALGFDAVARVFVPHPVQDRTDAEVTQYADDVIDALLAACVSS